MPARKSRASRIMGDRAVRSMAVSTSASADASVPSTISTTIGSIIGALEQQVAEIINSCTLTREHDRRGAEFLDDRGTLDTILRLESVATVNRSGDATV